MTKTAATKVHQVAYCKRGHEMIRVPGKRVDSRERATELANDLGCGYGKCNAGLDYVVTTNR